MIQFIRNLNPPYTRLHFAVEGIFSIVDGTISLLSFGYLRSSFRLWWTQRGLDNFFRDYLKDLEV